MRVKNRVPSVQVVADDSQVVSHVGAAMLSRLSDRLGLTAELSGAMAPTRSRDRGHDPGCVLRDLIVTLADGGEFVTDTAVLRGQPELFGQVASVPTIWRTVHAIDEDALERLRVAHARVRDRVRSRRSPRQRRRAERHVVDVDCSVVISHSDAKEGTAGTYTGEYGYHPALCYLDATGEALSALLRPGNASAANPQDLISAVELAVQQLPADAKPGDVLIRSDTAGASRDFVAWVADRRMRFSVGYPVRHIWRQIGDLAPLAWRDAVDADGEPVEYAQVAEIPFDTQRPWPEHSRWIVRRERAHPGAQLTMLDHEGYRYQVVLTNQSGDDIAALEAMHRGRARCEQRIEQTKQTGLAKLPSSKLAANRAWAQLALIAHDLVLWAQQLLFDGDLARCQLKRLRFCVLHAAGRLTHHARRRTLHLPRRWPWTIPIQTAHERLAAL